MLQQLSVGFVERQHITHTTKRDDKINSNGMHAKSTKSFFTLPVPGPPQIYKNPGLGNVIPSIEAPVIIDFSRKSLIPCSFDETTDDEVDFDNCFILNDVGPFDNILAYHALYVVSQVEICTHCTHSTRYSAES
jgi:hypothetical protein